jgi:hypothetical protein
VYDYHSTYPSNSCTTTYTHTCAVPWSIPLCGRSAAAAATSHHLIVISIPSGFLSCTTTPLELFFFFLSLSPLSPSDQLCVYKALWVSSFPFFPRSPLFGIIAVFFTCFHTSFFPLVSHITSTLYSTPVCSTQNHLADIIRVSSFSHAPYSTHL